MWLGQVDASGNQDVFIHWGGYGTQQPGELHDMKLTVHVGVGQSLQFTDFIGILFRGDFIGL